MAIKKDVDELLAGANGKDVFGKNGLFDELKKALAERRLNAQMDHHRRQLSLAAIKPIIGMAIRKRRF
jgi:hypothetical protein